MSFLSSDLQTKVQITVGALNFDEPISIETFNTFYTSVTSLHAEVAAEVAAKAAVVATATEATEVTAKPKRKATTTKQKADAVEAVEAVAAVAATVSLTVSDKSLLEPVDTKSTVTSSLVPITDPYSGHKYRLAAYDPTVCTGRKVDEKVVVPGTDPKDTGHNGKIFAEKQCSKTPMPGQALCKTCCEKDDAIKKDPTKKDKRWNGRLDEPMFDQAYVIGSNYFFKKYPNGLLNDPTTAPINVTAVATAPKPAPVATAPAPTTAPVNTIVETKEVKEKKPRAKKGQADLSDTKASVANTEVAPIVPEFVTFLCDSDGTGKKLHIRIVSNGKTYKADSMKKTPQEMVIRDKYVGRWQNDALNVNASESDDDE